MSNSFTKQFRLTSEDDIRQLHKKGRYYKESGLLFLAMKNNLSHGRLLIAAPKRFCKLSIERNRFKRLVRESFRLNQKLLSGYDFKVSINGKINGNIPSFNNIQNAIILVAERFNQFR